MDFLLSRTKPNEAGCAEWQGALDGSGYAQVWCQGKVRKAHRLAFVFVKGPIPEGMCICHTCDNPKCINPAHLFIGTHQDNMSDKDAKGRTYNGRAARTHCPAGHELSGDNLRAGQPVRQCRICKNERRRIKKNR